MSVCECVCVHVKFALCVEMSLGHIPGTEAVVEVTYFTLIRTVYIT